MVGENLTTLDLLEVNQLGKQIGAKRILTDVSFRAETGDLLVLTGPNGVGKTTLLRILAGLSTASAGEILWNGLGYDLNHGQIGYVSHKPMLYETLSVQENLVFFAQMYGRGSTERVRELLSMVGLWLHRYEPVAILSRGMQQRLALARTLIAEAKLILYDEPFTGLDQEGQALLRAILTEQRTRSIQIVIAHGLELLDGLSYEQIRLQEGRLLQGGLRDA